MALTIPYRITHPYFTTKRVYQVDQVLETLLNGVATKTATTFDFEYFCHNQKENTIVIVIKKHSALALPGTENNFLELLQQFEAYTYPIAVEVSKHGDFIHIVNHKNWLENWNKNTLAFLEQHSYSEEATDLQQQFYEIVKDENVFAKNKFKEPFWNLFFFNPAFDIKHLTPSAADITWDIKTFGPIAFQGTIQCTNTNGRTATTRFEATQPPDTALAETLQSMLQLPGTGWQQQAAKLEIVTEFDLMYDRLQQKSAILEFTIGSHFSYLEKTIITLKKIIDK
jgi:hypothetical protein